MTKSKHTGRPSSYCQDYYDKAVVYLNNHVALGDPVPTIEGLSDELDISRPTLYRWGENFEDFRYILDKLMTKQGRKLLAGGLTGEYSAPFAKMMATKHGYSDRIEQDVTSSDRSMTPISIELVGILPADHDSE